MTEHWKCPTCGADYFPDAAWGFIEFRCQRDWCGFLCILQGSQNR